MSFAPSTLAALGRYWIGKEGVMLGIVGDAAHTVGYHLGKDRIYDGAGPGRGDDDYSVRHERDRAGLSNAAAAIDLGKLQGNYFRLYDFSRWLVKQCQAGNPGTRDIREIIYSPDGDRVQRYSGIDGQIHTGEGNGDFSHRTHTHISYFRDSETRDKVSVFAAYWSDNVAQAGITTEVPKLIDIPKGAELLDLDGETKLYTNAADRIGILSPYGRGSEVREDGLRWARREFAIDPDGSGPDRRRTVLVWLPSTAVHPLEPGPAGAPDVLTSEDGAVTYNRV